MQDFDDSTLQDPPSKKSEGGAPSALQDAATGQKIDPPRHLR